MNIFFENPVRSQFQSLKTQRFGRGAGCGGDRADRGGTLGRLREDAERLAEEAEELAGQVTF
jgi:hypothetical protein